MDSNVCLMMIYIHKAYLFIFNNTTTIFMYVYNLYAFIKYIHIYTYIKYTLQTNTLTYEHTFRKAYTIQKFKLISALIVGFPKKMK